MSVQLVFGRTKETDWNTFLSTKRYKLQYTTNSGLTREYLFEIRQKNCHQEMEIKTSTIRNPDKKNNRYKKSFPVVENRITDDRKQG